MAKESEHLKFLEHSARRLHSYLCECVKTNNVRDIKLAVQKGFSVNTCDNTGVTPLHIASMCNISQQCLKELLKSESANINTKTCYGDTPLIYSCQTSSDKILKTLIEHGANVNLSNFKKLTPLHIACWNGSLKAVKLLIEAGANINAKDTSDWTPLHKTIGNVEMCKYLLQHGADANIPNDHGLLALHTAVLKKNCEVFDLIRNNTSSEAIFKYCTFPGPNGIDLVNRSILCLALNSRKKVLIERVLKSGLPKDVLNCPVVVKQSILLNDYLNENGELIDEFDEKLVLLSPLCFCLHLHCGNYSATLNVLQMLIDNNICITRKYNTSDNLYVVGPIEVMLHTWYRQIDRFKIISVLLENSIDVDEECNGIPTKLLKLCLVKNVDKCIFMLLLKASNIVEPEDLFRWIIDNRNRDFMHYSGMQDLILALLVMSPYVSISSCVYSYFLTLPCVSVEEKNTSQKLKQICERPVRPLASYCRTIVRRQLHCETRNNHRQFTDKLNSLPVPVTVISYLKFSEIKLIVNEFTDTMVCQVICDL